jgi:hypothetical protein
MDQCTRLYVPKLNSNGSVGQVLVFIGYIMLTKSLYCKCAAITGMP